MPRIVAKQVNRDNSISSSASAKDYFRVNLFILMLARLTQLGPRNEVF